MRYIPISTAEAGMVMARNLYDANNQLLLREGNALKEKYISKIEQLGCQGVYIDDGISQDIEIEDVVSLQTRRKMIYAVKAVYDEMSHPERKRAHHITNYFNVVKDIVKEVVDEILDSKNSVINLIDIKNFEEYVYYHSVNVTILAIVMGKAMQLKVDDLNKLGIAAAFIDIGLIGISKDIILKAGELSEDEYITVRSHTDLGYEYCKGTHELSAKSYIAILQHHENYNGTGYPQQKKGDEISLFARILAIADVYDALISTRPYREAYSPSEAMEYVMANGGSLFDPKVVKVFMDKIAAYPMGTSLVLSDNRTGLVVENNEGTPLRPTVKIYKGSNGEEIEEPYIIDLSDIENMAMTIIGVAGVK